MIKNIRYEKAWNTVERYTLKPTTDGEAENFFDGEEKPMSHCMQEVDEWVVRDGMFSLETKPYAKDGNEPDKLTVKQLFSFYVGEHEGVKIGEVLSLRDNLVDKLKDGIKFVMIYKLENIMDNDIRKLCSYYESRVAIRWCPLIENILIRNNVIPSSLLLG